MDSQIWHSLACCEERGLRKGTMASASTSAWEKAAPLALTMMPDYSVTPHMSLVPFKLLSLSWSSEGVSLSKSVHRPFKRNCPGFQKLSVSLGLNPQPFLQPEVMGTSLPGTGTLGWGAWYRAGTPHYSGRISAADISLLTFIHHMWVLGQPSPLLYLSLRSQCGFLFHSPVVGLPFS